MAHDLSSNFDEFFPQAGQRPLLDPLRQRPQEIAEIVGPRSRTALAATRLRHLPMGADGLACSRRLGFSRICRNPVEVARRNRFATRMTSSRSTAAPAS